MGEIRVLPYGAFLDMLWDLVNGMDLDHRFAFLSVAKERIYCGAPGKRSCEAAMLIRIAPSAFRGEDRFAQYFHPRPDTESGLC